MLAGMVTIIDRGAPLGRFEVLTAAEGIRGDFSTVVLPDESWFLDTTDRAIYVVHVPEPATVMLLATALLCLHLVGSHRVVQENR